MKRFCVGVLICIIFLSGCINRVTKEPFENISEVPSGYIDYGVQKEYLFYNGNLYEYLEIVSALNEDNISDKCPDFTNVGVITAISDYEIPDEEFEATRYEVGYVVYASETNIDYVFVKTRDHMVRMKIVEE